MDYEHQVRSFIAQSEQADAEASESMLAFASGKFPELWERKVREVAERLGMTNGNSDSTEPATDAAGRGQREDSGGDARDVSGSESRGPGGSPEDAGRPRAESAERLQPTQ